MALQKLREHFNETNRENIIEMLKNRVLVTEKIAAPSFHMQRNSNGFEFFKELFVRNNPSYRYAWKITPFSSGC